jgi:hypothetical protein
VSGSEVGVSGPWPRFQSGGREARRASASPPSLDPCSSAWWLMPVAKEAPVATGDRVHRKRDAREQRAHLIRQVRAVAAFDYEMQMIFLHRVVKNTHALSLRCRDHAADRGATRAGHESSAP